MDQLEYQAEMDSYAGKMQVVVKRYGIDPITIISILIPIIMEIVRRCEERPERMAVGLLRRKLTASSRAQRALRRYCQKVDGTEYMYTQMLESTFDHCSGLGGRRLSQVIWCMQQGMVS